MGDSELLSMGDSERRAISYEGVWVCEACGMSPLVCVPLSFISFFPQDESEDVEASDDNEEAEEEEGRSNGFHPSMRTPLAVISHG